jgi:acetyl esterase
MVPSASDIEETSMTNERPDARSSWSDLIAGLEAMTEAERRQQIPGMTTEQLAEDFPALADIEVREETIDGDVGLVPARSYRGPGARDAIGLVWVHGGAFIGGHLDMPEAHWVSLMLASRGFSVLSVDYRKCLCGVHFPAPSDDVLAAWQWAVRHAETLGTSAQRLHLGGASAGANLVAGVTKRLRDVGELMPQSIVLVYPLVHPELPPVSAELQEALRVDPPVLPLMDGVRELNVNFVGNEVGLADPYAFAGLGDVSGQPPIYVLNAEADELRSSGEAYADRLRGAGVPVLLEFEPGARHGHINEPYLDAAQRSVDRIVHWLAGELGHQRRSDRR